MDPFDLIKLIFIILFVACFFRVKKLKAPCEFFFLDFVSKISPLSKPDSKKELETDSNQTELYTDPNVVENLVFEMVDKLLTKTNVKNIGVLVSVANSSSTISLSSMIGKKYKLKEDIASYDLNGKGFDSGFIAITLAKKLLKVKGDCYALLLIEEEVPEGRHVSTANNPKTVIKCRTWRCGMLGPNSGGVIWSGKRSETSIVCKKKKIKPFFLSCFGI